MVTGDNEKRPSIIGKLAHVDQVVAEVLPEDKAQVVNRLQNEGKTVMMVGDGINDAPALVQADVGCAVGNGSDIALESGDVVLMKSDLMDVYRAVKLSKATIRNIKQNLFWAFFYNSLGIPVAAGVLYLLARFKPYAGRICDVFKLSVCGGKCLKTQESEAVAQVLKDLETVPVRTGRFPRNSKVKRGSHESGRRLHLPP